MGPKEEAFKRDGDGERECECTCNLLTRSFVKRA